MASRESSQLQEQAPCCPPPDSLPTLCLNNCGFFGTRENNNLCSSCFKKALMASLKPSPPSLQQAGSPTLCLGPASLCSLIDHHPLPSSTNAEPDPTLSTSSTGEAPQAPQKPNRCFSCRKRVGLTGFRCRCGDVFCSLHRYSEKHDCSFDYKAAARDTIAKENPVVKADKVTKI